MISILQSLIRLLCEQSAVAENVALRINIPLLARIKGFAVVS